MNANQAATVAGIKASRIRKWISRGQVKRLPDGSVDLESLADRMQETVKPVTPP